MSFPVVLINVFEVPAGMENAFIEWWKRSSEALQKEQGFIDAQLHQSHKPDTRFQFINIAHWETEDLLITPVSETKVFFNPCQLEREIPRSIKWHFNTDKELLLCPFVLIAIC